MATRQFIKPFDPNVDRDSFGHWLSGFSDGEASFMLRMQDHNYPGQGTYKSVEARFTIELRDDDRTILEEIQSFLRCGYIVARKGRQGWRPSARFYVSKASENFRLVVPNFERYPLRAKKQRDFAIWRQAVELVYGITRRKRAKPGRQGFGPVWTEKDVIDLQSLVAALKDQRTYNAPVIEVAAPAKSNGDLTQTSLF
jgi:hypothetical protein